MAEFDRVYVPELKAYSYPTRKFLTASNISAVSEFGITAATIKENTANEECKLAAWRVPSGVAWGVYNTLGKRCTIDMTLLNQQAAEISDSTNLRIVVYDPAADRIRGALYSDNYGAIRNSDSADTQKRIVFDIQAMILENFIVALLINGPTAVDNAQANVITIGYFEFSPL